LEEMNCKILKLALVRILFPKPCMLLFSFIININYPVGRKRVNIHHQTSGFENSFLEKNITCETESIQPPSPAVTSSLAYRKGIAMLLYFIYGGT
jgi:hypothetical protein